MCKVLGFSVLAGDSNQSIATDIACTGWQQQPNIRKYKAEVVQMIQHHQFGNIEPTCRLGKHLVLWQVDSSNHSATAF